MQKATDKLNSGLKLIAILVVAILATGCISAKSKPTEEAAAAEPAVEPATAVVEVAAEPEALTSWTVVDGNNLWGIACKEEVYNVPEKWPLIYKANIDQIVDADLIYPGQVFTIPRDSSDSEVDVAINHAKTRGAWAVGPMEATDKEYLKNSG